MHANIMEFKTMQVCIVHCVWRYVQEKFDKCETEWLERVVGRNRVEEIT